MRLRWFFLWWWRKKWWPVVAGGNIGRLQYYSLTTTRGSSTDVDGLRRPRWFFLWWWRRIWWPLVVRRSVKSCNHEERERAVEGGRELPLWRESLVSSSSWLSSWRERELPHKLLSSLSSPPMMSSLFQVCFEGQICMHGSRGFC